MRFNRIAGTAGLVGAAMWIVGFVVLPAPPSVGAAADDIAEFASHTGALFASVYLVDVLPAIAFLALGVGLWHHLRSDAAWATLGLLGVTGLTIAMFGWGVTDALMGAQGDRAADVATLQSSFELYNIGHIPAHASIAVLTLAFTLAGVRARLFSRYTKALGVFAGLSALAVLPAGFVHNGTLETAHIISVLAFVGWIAASSLTLLRTAEPTVELADHAS